LDVVKHKSNFTNSLLNDYTDGPPYTSYYTVAADSAATDHFFSVDAPVTNRQRANKPISIRAADGGIMKSTHTGNIELPRVPATACKVHIVPGLASVSLLAMGPLCDAGCKIEFDATTVQVWYQGHVVLTGHRAPPGLWLFQLPSTTTTALPTIIPTIHEANAVIGAPKAAELVRYSHTTLFSPALDTLEKALTKGFVRNFPGLTAKTLRRHPPKTVATAKGHLDQVRKNLRSTRVKASDMPSPDDADVFPEQAAPTSTCYVMTVEFPTAPTGKYYTDQTGAFPVTSSSGNKYVLVAYHYDSNAILVEAIPNRQQATIIGAHKTVLKRLRRAGTQCSFILLDNE
jgi:hypothetical protein